MCEKMINRELITNLETWFLTYAGTYIEKYPHAAEELCLKRDHSLRVRDEMNAISADLQCSEVLSLAAEAAALLHDVGRFAQFAQYGTFADARSEDHAAIALQVIRENMLLEPFGRQYPDIIRFAIEQHNKRSLPEDAEEDYLFMAQMLRDADKIDIFRVVTGYFQNSDSRGIAAMLGLPDIDRISGVICDDIRSGKTPRMADLESSNDMKLLMMSWVYDLNFPVTVKTIHQRGYIDIIKRYLPDVPVVSEIYGMIKSRMEETSLL